MIENIKDILLYDFFNHILSTIDSNLDINKFDIKSINRNLFNRTDGDNNNFDLNFFKKSLLNYKNIKLKDFFLETIDILKNENKFLNLDFIKNENIYIVGDIHGDLFTLFKIIFNYLSKDNIIIFLGDYVDRGYFSKEVIVFILFFKVLYPQNIFLLAGNHEIYFLIEFYPCDFWNSSFYKNFKNEIDEIFDNLPITGKINNIIFLHGIPYEFESINNFQNELNKYNKISEIFNSNKDLIYSILWGDIKPDNISYFFVRSKFVIDENGFKRLKEKLKFDYLVRSHQPDVKGFSFNNKCITLITSDFYSLRGTIDGNIILKINKKDKMIDKSNIIKI